MTCGNTGCNASKVLLVDQEDCRNQKGTLPGSCLLLESRISGHLHVASSSCLFCCVVRAPCGLPRRRLFETAGRRVGWQGVQITGALGYRTVHQVLTTLLAPLLLSPPPAAQAD